MKVLKNSSVRWLRLSINPILLDIIFGVVHRLTKTL